MFLMSEMQEQMLALIFPKREIKINQSDLRDYKHNCNTKCAERGLAWDGHSVRVIVFPYPTHSHGRRRSNGPDPPKHCQGHTTGQGPAKPGTQNLLHLNVGCALDLECGPVVPLPYRPCPHFFTCHELQGTCQDVRQSAGRRDSQGERPSPHVGLISMRVSITLPSAVTLCAHS